MQQAQKHAYNLQQMTRLAEYIVETMRPYCDRVEIAGSLRRRKANPKDIEIVAIPKQSKFIDLFETKRANCLYDWAKQVENEDKIHWIKPNTEDVIRWPLDPDGRYWRGWLVKGEIKLDLFLTTPETWGATFMIRTGSSEFNQRVFRWAEDHTGHKFYGGKMHDTVGRFVPTPEEESIFEILGMPYVEPAQRY